MTSKTVFNQTKKAAPNLSRPSAIGCVCIAAVLWSTAGLFFKWVPWHPVAIAGVRSGIAAAVLLTYWLAVYKKLPPLPAPKKALGALNYMVLVMLFTSANKLTTAANAILLQFTAPIWVIIFAKLFLKEPVRRSGVIASIVVFLGMGLFFIDNLNAGGALGNVLAVISGIAMAIMVVSLKGVKTGSPLEIIFWGNIFTFVAAAPFYGGIQSTPQSLLSIVTLGIFQVGIAYVFYGAGVQKLSALEGVLITVLEPLLNPVWVILFYGESPSLFALIGGGIVIAAVIIQSIISNKRTACIGNISGDGVKIE